MDQATFDAVMARVADGEPLRRILRELNFSWTQYEKRLNQGDNVLRYARAKEIAMEALADEIIDIADNGSNDFMERNYGGTVSWQENGEALRRSALRVDTRKWIMAKLAPKKYGNDTSVSLGDGVKVIVQRDDADL